MSSTDRLDVLRERNKDLMNKLKQQREKLEQLCGFSKGRKREREGEAEEGGDRAEILTLTGGNRGTARAALAKPTLRFAGNQTCGRRQEILAKLAAT